jgi:hypothetical protein
MHRLTRVDSEGVPKIVQYIEYDYDSYAFTIELFDRPMRIVDAGYWDVDLMQKEIPNNLYQRIENDIVQMYFHSHYSRLW